MSELSASFRKRVLLVAACFVLLPLCLVAWANVAAQTVEAFGDDAADPVRLFERGQGAHARGELEKALACLERAEQARSGWLVYLRTEPRFDPLRGAPRFQELLSRL